MKDAQEVDEVTFDVTLGREKGELILAESKRAQMVELLLHILLQMREWIGGMIATHKSVRRLIARKEVQERLPHRELVQVRVEQRANDWRERGHECDP